MWHQGGPERRLGRRGRLPRAVDVLCGHRALLRRRARVAGRRDGRRDLGRQGRGGHVCCLRGPRAAWTWVAVSGGHCARPAAFAERGRQRREREEREGETENREGRERERGGDRER